jgi:phosphomannomutase/phosphoglucomutase
VANVDLDDGFVIALGDALGAMFHGAGARRISLGRDCRLSSPRLHAVLRSRLLAGGLDIVDVGVLHSPGLYFSVFHLGTDGGVMITGSHNPSEDNGFKIMLRRDSLFGQDIQRLRTLAEAGARAPAGKSGALQDVDVLAPYVEHIAGTIQPGARRFGVVVDAGNGTGGLACVPILRKLGFEVEPLYCEPDGAFPNHHPDPTVPKNLGSLIERVRQTGAEVGIALDGDADRIGAVDAQGRIVWGDQLTMLFARQILQNHPGATIVSEVKCSQALFDDIAAHGGKAIMGKVGHSLMKKKMKEEHALLAGELSGHIFFADRYFGFDDGVYAAARLVELLSLGQRTLADIVSEFPQVYNTPEIRVPCPDDIKFEVVRRAVAHYQALYDVVAIDGVRVSFPGGWGLVRASNTGPVLVLRSEAESPERVREIQHELETRIEGFTREIQREKAS